MVSIERYNCFCKKGGVERFTSNKTGKVYIRCKEDDCNLFVPEGKFYMLMDAYAKRVHNSYKPWSKFPTCACGVPCALYVSESEKNPGRAYFRCRDNDTEDRCDAFIWADKKSWRKVKPKRKTEPSKQVGEPSTRKRKKTVESTSSGVRYVQPTPDEAIEMFNETLLQ